MSHIDRRRDVIKLFQEQCANYLYHLLYFLHLQVNSQIHIAILLRCM